MSVHRFEIRSTWDGQPALDAEAVDLTLELAAGDASGRLRVSAPYHGDPAPDAPPGRLDGLWDHEVVELFLLGTEQRYLEIELGPHGHWLGLRLAGRRRVVDDAVPIQWNARIEGARWTGEARFAQSALPPGSFAANAYAIHGVGASRRHLAWRPVHGDEPDFHRLEAFGALELVEGDA